MPFGSGLPDDELRSLARQRIDKGQLPLALTGQLYAGRGSGQRCVLCAQKIAPEHVEFEIDLASEARTLLFHLRCHNTWQLECVDRMRAKPAIRVTETGDEGTIVLNQRERASRP